MATTAQMHHLIAPEVRIKQTRRRLAKLRQKDLIDRITLPQTGRTRVWYPTRHGAQLAGEWPEMRGRRPPRGAVNRTAVQSKVEHGLTITQTAPAFLKDARHRGDLCRPLDLTGHVHGPRACWAGLSALTSSLWHISSTDSRGAR
ncbi:replication-relaxation family protein [Streptomyces sp. enrichment culture]|uniref:replication-relaxation family protein n=1 Tax=Streptomyces sp. enrichment culture TaxID=1795815 RepID=UPI003F56E4BF